MGWSNVGQQWRSTAMGWELMGSSEKGSRREHFPDSGGRNPRGRAGRSWRLALQRHLEQGVVHCTHGPGGTHIPTSCNVHASWGCLWLLSCYNSRTEPDGTQDLKYILLRPLQKVIANP